MPEENTLKLAEGNSFVFNNDLNAINISVEWTTKQAGLICDLDLTCLVYDERARYTEKVDHNANRSKDESLFLSRKFTGAGTEYSENLEFNFSIVTSKTSAVVLLLDGGHRNFNYLQSVSLKCEPVEEKANMFGDLLPSRPNEDEEKQKGPLFKIFKKTRNNYKGLVLCALYKDGWNRGSGTPVWTSKCFLEPLYVASNKDKQEKCAQLVIAAVPALEKFRPRLFASVRDICAALSSHSLPKLKKKFQKAVDGLAINQFIEVVFKQLYESHPKIIEDTESSYTCAMLQEMFHQIDYNGDGSCDWDEFTSFCVQTGLSVSAMSKPSGGDTANNYSLDQYVIEYGEELLQRDTILSAHRYVAMMRHVSETKRLLVVSEDANNVMVLDEKFRLFSQIYPSKVQAAGSLETKAQQPKVEVSVEPANNTAQKNNNSNAGFPRVMVYDCIYLAGRDLYCFSSSDHCITICKESITMGGLKVSYVQHNRIYHQLLHLKLCWSQKHDILCTTASDRTIYGWNIDTGQVLFQVSRHTDIITDFVSADHLDVFVTGSMDKRIVMWNAVTRRVKGIFVGHKRGIRCLSIFENIMLSGAFECDARTWDLTTREPIAILKGHRHPIAAAKLMCDKAQLEKEHRAITVDEGGEFRLWNIYVREKTSEPALVPTIQIFEMQNSEAPLNQFRFLALPYHPKTSTSYYSNLIACSTKLMHFLPEKNMKEFIPPTASVCSEASSLVVTAIGKNILLYDLSAGEFSVAFEGVTQNEIFSICMDGERGRRMFVGTNKGEILLVNTTNGVVIDQLTYHTKEVTSICQRKDTRNCIYSCSSDGNLRMYEESGGKLSLNSSIDSVFGEGVGLAKVKNIPSLHILLVASSVKSWGVLHESSFKKLLIVHEADIITSIEVIGASGDKQDKDQSDSVSVSSAGSVQAPIPHPSSSNRKLATVKDRSVTLAVALSRAIMIYCFDAQELRGVKTFELRTDTPCTISDMCLLRGPDANSVNYSSMRDNSVDKDPYQLVAVADEGKIFVWNTGNIRATSESKLKLAQRGMSRTMSTPHTPSKPNSAANHAVNKFPEILLERPASPLGKAMDPLSLSSAFLTGVDGQAHVQFGPDSSPTSSSSPVRSAGRKRASTPKSWLEAQSAEIFPVAGDNPLSMGSGLSGRRASRIVVLAPVLKPGKVRVAHSDIIPAICPLHANSCFITVSLDGYHRVWNLDQDLLGELPLPNITEQMKSKSMVEELGATPWKFILERVPVTQFHIEMAASLIKSLKMTGKEKLAEQKANIELGKRYNNIPVGFKGFQSSDENDLFQESEIHDESFDRDSLRSSVLQSLNEPVKLSESHPPTRLPTKEEKELIRLAFSTEYATRSFVSTPGSPPMPGSPNSQELLQPSDSLLSPSRGSTSAKKKRRGGGSLSEADTNTLRKSLTFAGDSSVCMSSFGIESLWIVPGERDIFGRSVMGGATDAPERIIPPPFSDQSLNEMAREGLIDNEARRLLKVLSTKADRVEAYDRTQPTLLIRNASMSTSVKLPPLESVQKTEIVFGAQKDMYKNASKFLKDKSNMSKSMIRDQVALSRIDENVRKVNSMIHLIPPPSHDEVILPKGNDEDGSAENFSNLLKGKNDETKMKIRLMKSAALVPLEAKVNARPLDRHSIDRWTGRIDEAFDRSSDAKRTGSPGRDKKENISHALVAAVERKLQAAIKGRYRLRASKFKKSDGDDKDKEEALDEDDLIAIEEMKKVAPRKIATLTTRELLPYYKLEAVHQFMDIFAKVDENFSGDLDVNEWIKLFTSLNEAVPVQEARMIFMKIDKDGDGFLSMRELIPVVFNKASRVQQKKIVDYAEMELIKKIETETVPKVSIADLDFLFEVYDFQSVGFVDVSLIRERVRKMKLSEQALFFFLDLISDMAEDDMVNLQEFKRMFKIFTASNR